MSWIVQNALLHFCPNICPRELSKRTFRVIFALLRRICCSHSSLMVCSLIMNVSVAHLLMEETLGTVSLSQMPSASSRSRISHANMVGLCLLQSAILSTTFGVATFGLEPPITPGFILPVSQYLQHPEGIMVHADLQQFSTQYSKNKSHNSNCKRTACKRT